MIPYLILAIEDESDREFMTTLYLNYRRLIYSEILKIVPVNWAAGDVYQSTLIKLINKVDELKKKDAAHLINYVIATAKNTSLNYLRDTKKYFAYSFDDFLCCPDDDGHSRYVEASLIRQEDVEALAKVWPKLDPKIRYILEEKYVLDKSSAEIAQDLGIKPDSVRMALTRARRAALSLLKSNQ